MRLLVDLGNTRLKWASSDAGQWRGGAASHRGMPLAELLDEHWGELPVPERVVAVTVAADTLTQDVERWVREHWRLGVQRVRSQPEQLGVVNRYRDPAQLGADRWAALIGARAELPHDAVCVISCGTAVTIDALTRGGEFVGGVIFPGLALLYQALTNGTAGVRAAAGNETSCLARSTDDAVAAGAVYGLAGAIERVAGEFEQVLGESMKLLITGGDADRLAPHLTRPVRRSPDLVLEALDRIADTL